MTAANEEDFTGELVPGSPAPVVETRIRSIPERRESTRGILAVGMAIVFALIALGSGIAVWTGTDVDKVKGLLDVLLPPVVALTGTAMGFYFGGERSERASGE